MTVYYSRYICHYSDHAQVLYQLLTNKGTRNFEWTEACEHAFQFLKNALCSAPVLAYPDFSREFRIYCDASEFALGGVLCQLNDENLEQPICYFSRVLNRSEKRFRPYIYAGSCTVFTDNQAVMSLLRAENPSQHLAKWQYCLVGETDWKVKFVEGAKNVVADALSRIPDFSGCSASNPEILAVTTRAQTKRAEQENASADLADDARSESDSQAKSDTLKNSDCDPNLAIDLDDLDDSGIAVDPDLVQSIESSQIEDEDLCDMRNYIERSVLPKDPNKSRLIICKRPLYQLINGVLKHLDPHKPGELHVVVPLKLHTEVLTAYHDHATGGY